MRQTTYTPRRASKTRWLEGAPEYILDVYDNKGETADRYTVLFTGSLLIRNVSARGIEKVHVLRLDMSDAPSHRQGVSMWSELVGREAANYRHAAQRQRIRWLDLPEAIRSYVLAHATES